MAVATSDTAWGRGSDGTYFVSGLVLQNIRCVNSSDELPQFARLPLGKN